MTVVTDHYHAAGESGQPGLQPGDRGQVEMVGGLVEDQQLGGSGQDPGQRHPLGLTAREVSDALIDHRGHAQPVEDRLGFPALADRLADGAVRQRSVLVQEADADPPALSDLASLGGLDAGQNPQQGRLAGAVDPDHAEAVPVGHRDRQAPRRAPGRRAAPTPGRRRRGRSPFHRRGRPGSDWSWPDPAAARRSEWPSARPPPLHDAAVLAGVVLAVREAADQVVLGVVGDQAALAGPDVAAPMAAPSARPDGFVGQK